MADPAINSNPPSVLDRALVDYRSIGIYVRKLSETVNPKYYHFESVSRHHPTAEDLAAYQRSLGYDPRGYGDPMLTSTHMYNGFYVTRWRVFANAD